MRRGLLVLSLLALSGCTLPLEEHGGLAPRPEPSDLVFMGTGAAINTAGLALHLPQWVRFTADAAAVVILRVPKFGGRYEGVAITLPVGSIAVEWVHTLVHGLQHPTHPACDVTRGPDTMVTQPIALHSVRGYRWGNDCLTWAEIRRLRHSY